MSAIAILIASTLIASPETTLRVAPRPRLDVVFDAPPAGIAGASRSDMVRAVARATSAFTDLSAREAPGPQVQACFDEREPAPLLCLLLGLRPTFEAVRSAAPSADFDAVWARTRQGDPNASDLVMLVIYAPVLEQQQVQAALIDLKVIARRYTRWTKERRLTREDRSALQDELFESAVLTRPPVNRAVANATDVQVFMNDLFRISFSELLQQRSLREFGGVDISVPAGARLFLDDTTVGSTESLLTRVRDIPAGRRRLRIEHPDYLAFEQTVEVVAERTVFIEPTLIPGPNQGAVAARDALFWTGIATTAAGIAVTALAVVSGEESNCFPEGSPGCPPDPAFTELGPFLGAPLGYSLMGAGATWSLAAWLNDDDQAWPWWEFALGLVVAGTSYGLSVALNPERPPTE